MTKRDKHGRFEKNAGIIKHKGYLAVYMPNHPRAKANGYVFEHILVAENKIGRQLTTSEVVHHIDGNKLNNAPDNLRIFPTQSEHMLYHWNKEREIPSISALARAAGKKPSTVYQRVKKLGWSIEDALSK